MKYISQSVDDTMNIAVELANTLTGGEFISLIGELGVGKTVFAKGIAIGLGIDEVVTSPTFSLHNIYSGRLTLNHFDFYRLMSIEEAVVLGLDEHFYSSNSVTLAEWCSNISEIIPTDRITVSITRIDETSRSIEIEGI